MKQRTSLVTSHCVSAYIYLIVFHGLIWGIYYSYKSCSLSAGMWHYVAIKFLGGENFGVAYLNSKTNDVHQKMAMLMGASSHTQLCHVASWGTDTELLATFLSLPVSPFCGFWFSVRGICQPQHSYDHSCCFRPTSKHIHSFLAPFSLSVRLWCTPSLSKNEGGILCHWAYCLSTGDQCVYHDRRVGFQWVVTWHQSPI